MAAILKKVEYKYFLWYLFWLFLSANTLHFLRNDLILQAQWSSRESSPKKLKSKMFNKISQRLRATPPTKIFKFILIFSVTGSSCLFISDKIAFYLESFAGLEQHIVIDVILVTITYQVLLLFFCFLFGEFKYVLGKYKRLKMLFSKDT